MNTCRDCNRDFDPEKEHYVICPTCFEVSPWRCKATLKGGTRCKCKARRKNEYCEYHKEEGGNDDGT